MTNYQQNQNKNQQQSTATSTTTSSTRGQACTSDVIIEMAMAQLVPQYERVLGPMAQPVAVFMAQLIAGGMEPAVIAGAIEETGWARWPSPYYLRAILTRYRKAGLMTVAQVEHEKAERRMDRYAAGQNREQLWYQTDDWRRT